ncbi:MAG: formate dehydrogenase accessory sulfurtransferase FdhD [Saprospiraceae bacterium]|nr:formate dehydrogenase accessory sulfurtransferase FdhD [Saprospiraceae bacterium]
MFKTKKKQIIRVHADESKHVEDAFAVEEPLQISLSYAKVSGNNEQKNISITMRTPGADRDLALGFLFTEGILNSFSEVADTKTGFNELEVVCSENADIDLSKIERHFYTSSSCGVCGKSSIDAIKTVRRIEAGEGDFKIDPAWLKTIGDIQKQSQDIFKDTGGIHAATLFEVNGQIMLSREDVGRHNAMDKLIGHAFQNALLPLDKHVVLLSGRASFELIQKASMAGVKCIAAIGAPSSLAIELAEESDMTLIGFLKPDRFNIYCGEKRISL